MMHTDPDPIRDLLRAGDPAAGADPLDAVERARILARIRSAAAAPHRAWWPRLPVAVAGLAAVLLAAYLGGWRLPSLSARRGIPPSDEMTSVPPPPADPLARPRFLDLRAQQAATRRQRRAGHDAQPRLDIRREIHLTAPNGTRIVWLLRDGPSAAADTPSEPHSRS